MRIFSTALVVIGVLSNLVGYTQDSTKIKIIDGREFIEHRVQEKETLYSLSRKYDVPIYRIIEYNPPTEFGLEIGTVINVPVIKKEVLVKQREEVIPKPQTEPSSKKKANLTTGPEIIRHTVETKQTLFSISKLYGVTIEEIRNWNGLSSNSLDIGQMLIIKKIPEATDLPVVSLPSTGKSNVHVVEEGETLYSLSKRFNVSIEDIKQFNGLVSNDISIGQELVIGRETGSDTIVLPATDSQTPEDRDSITRALEAARKYEEELKPLNFEEIVESGVAEVILGTDNTRKYLALHRTAKAGTILKVRNDMNDQEVFVRVLGKLPDNVSNENVLIKLSQAAYNRLGAIDPKFRVTISYIP